jgi:hypothetical protein
MVIDGLFSVFGSSRFQRALRPRVRQPEEVEGDLFGFSASLKF